MSSVPSFSVFNFSAAFGGQERYIESLADEFERRQLSLSFTGGAGRLLKIRQCSPTVRQDTYSVELLNGNRSLYLRAWRKSNADIRVYVQHSLVQDAQGNPAKQWVRKVLLRLLLTRMDIVLRVCEGALPERYAPGKIRTVYNGVSLPDLPSTPPVGRPFTLLMVGAVNENKNQRLALQLLEQESDLRLLVVGDGPERAVLEQWAHSHGVNARVHWAGFVDDPSPFYLQSDALLMLSAYEAFPYVVLEAMAHAIPVVGTRVGGVPEAITHEQDGLLLPSRDLASLSAAVLRLRDQPQLRAQIGQRARQTVAERFTVEKMTDHLLDVISMVARNKGLVA